MNQQILIEICADSLESALTAQSGGAGRLELCSALEIGGLTPSIGLINFIIKHLKIPVNVLIRPRSGDFIYSDDEIKIMQSDIHLAKSAGAAGIVTGALQSDGSVNKKQMLKLMESSYPLPVTFHRAFDLIHNKRQALEDIIELGCKRILTSGGFKTVTSGGHVISELIMQAQNRIIIMPGAGINGKNFAELVEATGCTEYHLSASSLLESTMEHESIHLNDVFPSTRNIADLNKVTEICLLASAFSD